MLAAVPSTDSSASPQTEANNDDVVSENNRLRGILDQVAHNLSAFGMDMAEIAGAIEEISGQSAENVRSFEYLTQTLQSVECSTDSINNHAETSRSISTQVETELDHSRDEANTALNLIEMLIDDVNSFEDSMGEVNEAMESVRKVVSMIEAIAKQTRLLSLNATIEAARAGEAGRGFTVVANEVKQLSKGTSDATEEIDSTMNRIVTSLQELNNRSSGTVDRARQVGTNTGSLTDMLTTVKKAVDQIDGTTVEIAEQSGNVGRACHTFTETFSQITDEFTASARALANFSDRLRSIADGTDDVVLKLAQSGLDTAEASYVAMALERANEISNLFEEAIKAGRISETDLFDKNYQSIEGSNPPQVTTKFTTFTDEVLPPVQEAILEGDQHIVFSACVDVNGYLPTHNLKFSKPQGDDPVWNASHCRNRRIFDDRAGLRAAQNERPILLQTYWRNMGGGQFVVMKELDTPIYVRGRRWGSLRIGFK